MSDNEEDGGGGGSGGSDGPMLEDGEFEFPENEEGALIPTYALIKNCDLPEETKLDIIDFVVAAVEHHLANPEDACKHIKENLDRIYGAGWHAVVGESYGFEISHDAQHYLYCFFNGNLGILVWKCTA